MMVCHNGFCMMNGYPYYQLKRHATCGKKKKGGDIGILISVESTE